MNYQKQSKDDDGQSPTTNSGRRHTLFFICKNLFYKNAEAEIN